MSRLKESGEPKDYFIRDVKNLTPKERDEVVRVAEAIDNRETAEAKKEHEKRVRLIFERAPPETIPFLVYCIYIGSAGLGSFFYLIINYQENLQLLYVLLGSLGIMLILPLFILPNLKIKESINWLIFWKKENKKKNIDKNTLKEEN
jgi:hypothetical protein